MQTYSVSVLNTIPLDHISVDCLKYQDKSLVSHYFQYDVGENGILLWQSLNGETCDSSMVTHCTTRGLTFNGGRSAYTLLKDWSVKASVPVATFVF